MYTTFLPMLMKRKPAEHAGGSDRVRPAFTLIEVLVVLFIFLILVAVALPTVKTLISDQKTSKTGRSIASFIDLARSRAIAEGRYFGVRIERLSNANVVEYSTSASIRVRHLTGTPPYTGEASNSKVRIETISGSIATLDFDNKDNQLLFLNNRLPNNPNIITIPNNNPNAPFQDRDIIEIAGGKQFHLQFIEPPVPAPPPPPPPLPAIKAIINLNSPVDGGVGIGTSSFPSAPTLAAGTSYPFRIYRRPTVSSSSLSFPRGVAIDLNYSGMGPTGSQFTPTTTGMNASIDILFGPDGRVEFITGDSTGMSTSPTGMIFLCLGSTDGVMDADAMPTELFSIEKRATANIMSLDSVWIVINPTTGRVATAPMAAVTDTTSLMNALREARFLARLSDTLDAAP